MNDKDSGVAIKYCSDGIYIKKDDMKRILLDKFFTKDQKKVAIDLICEKQTKMIIENKDNYDSDEYKELETIKVKIKNMWDLWGNNYGRYY
ncbi:hypothetical protein [Eubacterium ramulus]|jgi:hypothetical protein|uniref:hypothetical protein n=1 Tax=Eubacterium ramulus TaxID=39490 RepID=UPI00399A4F6B